MPTLEYVPEPPRTGSNYDASVLDQTLEPDIGPKPKRWKLRLRRKLDIEDKDGKKKNKKGKKKKHDTPPPEEGEEWELGPTMEEMRLGVLEKYFDDVRTRAKGLLEQSQQMSRKLLVPPTSEYLRNLLGGDLDEISSISTLLTESDMAKLPTILEASADGQIDPKSAATLHSILTQLSEAQSQKTQEEIQNIQRLLTGKYTPSDMASTHTKDDTSRTPSLVSASPTKDFFRDNSKELSSNDLRSKSRDIQSEKSKGRVRLEEPIQSPAKESKESPELGLPSDIPIDITTDLQDGESLNENEPMEPHPRLYEDNQFGLRITKENVLHYVQNKKSGFDPKKMNDSLTKNETLIEEEEEHLEEQEQEEEQEEEVMSEEEMRALFECVWEGDVDLLDDLLDLPGADINLKWYGENLLMTAIRAGKSEVAEYLIDNNIDTSTEVARFERREDVKIEIEMQKALEQTHEKGKKKKKKGKDKLQVSDDVSNDLSTIRDLSTFRDDQVKSPENKGNSRLTDMECYMLDCRGMAQEFGKFDIVEMIDLKNGQVWHNDACTEREPRLRQALEDKLRGHGLYIEEDDDNFMVEPDKPKPPPPEIDDKADDKRNRKSRQKSSDLHRKYGSTEPLMSHQPTPMHGQSHLPTPMHGRSQQATPLRGTTPHNPYAEQPMPEPDTTLAGTPAPPTPQPIIIHVPDKPKPKQQYKGTRAFLTRKAINMQPKDMFVDEEEMEIKPQRKLVESHGSYATESKNWLPPKTAEKQQNQLMSRSLGDFETLLTRDRQIPEVERYSRLRQVKPWQADNPVYFNNLLKRQYVTGKVPSLSAQNRPRLRRENTVLPIVGPNSLQKSNSMIGALRYPPTDLANSYKEMSPMRARISQSRQEQERIQQSVEVRDRLSKSTGHLLAARQPTFLSEAKSLPVTIQPRMYSQRGPTLNLNLGVLKPQINHSKCVKSKNKTNAKRVITMQKYYDNSPAKRLSPTGLIRASHLGLPPSNRVTDSIRNSMDKINAVPGKKFTRFTIVS